MSIYLHNRLIELENLAGECCESLPTEASYEEIMDTPEYTEVFFIYEECMEYINAIESELVSGEPAWQMKCFDSEEI
jgi:hypothetical protein